MKFAFFFAALIGLSIGSQSHVSTLTKITKAYKKAGYVQFQAEKIVTSELMGKENRYKGTFFYSKGKLRWETTEPEKTLMVYDGTILWNVQYPSPDFPGDPQAGKSKIDKKNKQQVLLAEFIGLQNLDKNFEISEKEENGEIIFNMKAKEKNTSITEAIIRVSKKDEKILEISYPDEVGNMTKLKFLETQINKKKKPELFQYVPEKNAKVTEL